MTLTFVFVLDALKQMLNLNQPLTKAVANEPAWKVLIYDRIGQDIISPLISVKELRELGVTLHVYVEDMLLFQDKSIAVSSLIDS